MDGDGTTFTANINLNEVLNVGRWVADGGWVGWVMDTRKRVPVTDQVRLEADGDGGTATQH